MKEKLIAFFSFSKKEYNGLLIFSLLIVLVELVPSIYSHFSTPEVFSFQDFQQDIEKLKASEKAISSNYRSSYDRPVNKTPAVLFDFDPNTVSAELWEKLGLSDRQIKVLTNYTSKGGRFYKPEDLKKIYSISTADYEILKPFIKIKPFEGGRNFEAYPAKETLSKQRVVIELNSADSVQLESVTGIGPAFAQRILKYRKRLGGFYKKEQLLEVYGVDSTKYQNLQDEVLVNAGSIEKIAINTAGFEELKRHPYLSYKQINAIVQYRKQHGNYRSIDDMKKVLILNDEILRKIAPYLNFDDK